MGDHNRCPGSCTVHCEREELQAQLSAAEQALQVAQRENEALQAVRDAASDAYGDYCDAVEASKDASGELVEALGRALDKCPKPDAARATRGQTEPQPFKQGHLEAGFYGSGAPWEPQLTPQPDAVHGLPDEVCPFVSKPAFPMPGGWEAAERWRKAQQPDAGPAPRITEAPTPEQWDRIEAASPRAAEGAGGGLSFNPNLCETCGRPWLRYSEHQPRLLCGPCAYEEGAEFHTHETERDAVLYQTGEKLRAAEAERDDLASTCIDLRATAKMALDQETGLRARAVAAESKLAAWLPVMQAAWNLYARALNATREQCTEDLLVALMMLPREQRP